MRSTGLPVTATLCLGLSIAACSSNNTIGNDAGDSAAPADGAVVTDATSPDVLGIADAVDVGVDRDTSVRDAALDAPTGLDASGPYCGASPGAHCYYIDAVQGSDANDGSLAHPWQTYLNVVSYYGSPGSNGSTAAPTGHVNLMPGDAVYFMDGTYTATFNYNGTTSGFFVRNVNGDATHPIILAAYPGRHPVISPPGTPGVDLLQSHDWALEGLEIANAAQRGLFLEESDRVTVHALHVRDTDGVDNDNVAGLYLLNATNIEVWDSEFNDNFDRTAADTGGQATENSTNVVLFDGGFVNFHDNHVYNTPATSNGRHGGGIKYKHKATATGGTFVVYRNRFENCRFMSIGTGSPNSTIVGNLIRDSDAILLKDFGGPTQLSDITISYNTLINSGIAIEPEESGAPATNLRLDHNVVIVAPGSNSASVSVGTYESDATYSYVTANGVLGFASNCYYEQTSPPVFDFFSAMGGSYGTLAPLRRSTVFALRNSRQREPVH